MRRLWRSLRGFGGVPSLGSSWESRLAHGVLWSTVATGVNYVAALTVLAVTGRLLGPAGYGAFGIVTSTVAMFGVLAGLGLGLAATKFVAELRAVDPARAGRVAGQVIALSLVAGIVVGALMAVLAPWLAAVSLGAPSLTGALRLGCLLLVVSAVQGAQAGALAGLEAFRAVARNNVIRGIVGIPLGILGAWWGGVPGAVVAATLTVAIGCWLNQRALRNACARTGITLGHRFEGDDLRHLWSFSLPALIAGAAVLPAQWLASAALARTGDGYEQLGLLAAANNWKSLITFLPVALAGAAMPALASLRGSGGSRELEVAHGLNQMVLWPIAVVTMLLAAPIMGTYGDAFRAGRVMFVVIVGGTAIGFVGNALGTLITSQGRMWLGAAQNLSFGIVLVGVSVMNVDRHGALAVALGTGAAYALLLTWTVIYLRLRGSITSSLVLRTLVGGALMAGATVVLGFVPATLAVWLTLPAAVIALAVAVGLIEPTLRRSLGRRLLNGLRAPAVGVS